MATIASVFLDESIVNSLIDFYINISINVHDIYIHRIMITNCLFVLWVKSHCDQRSFWSGEVLVRKLGAWLAQGRIAACRMQSTTMSIVINQSIACEWRWERGISSPKQDSCIDNNEAHCSNFLMSLSTSKQRTLIPDHLYWDKRKVFGCMSARRNGDQ